MTLGKAVPTARGHAAGGVCLGGGVGASGTRTGTEKVVECLKNR